MKDMLDKILQIEQRYKELGETLSDPAVIQDYNKFRDLSKQRKSMEETVNLYYEWKSTTEAIEDAKVNSALNGIDNTLFFAGDMKDILTDSFINEYGRPDVIITDPPRAGMHEDVINVILNAAPRRIVYVSCNPATQARDLQLLDVKYKVTAVQPVDMFPHTHHVENVVRLELK